MNDTEIKTKMFYWTKRLELDHWDIRLHIVDQLPEWDGGSNRICYDRNQSQIWITRENADIEWTIVHELLHLTLWYHENMNPTPIMDTLQERAINYLCGALLDRMQVGAKE